MPSKKLYNIILYSARTLRLYDIFDISLRFEMEFFGYFEKTRKK